MEISHAMLLCAGLGTRLRPLTDERPKPLIPVLDRPLAAWALSRLRAAGVRHVVANAHHLAAQIKPTLEPLARREGQGLMVLEERALLGTGGGIRNALPHLDDDFFVFNGDVLAWPDLSAAAEMHRSERALVTLIVREDPNAQALGAIEVDADGVVRRILGEGPRPRDPVKCCMFTGIYVVSRRIAADLPVEGCVVRHTLRRLLARGETVRAVIDRGPWFDLGTPRRYSDAVFALLRGELRALWDAPDAVWMGARCDRSDGVELVGPAAIGDDCEIRGEGTVERVIAWPGASFEAPLRGAIVTPRHRVDLDGAVEGA